MDRGAIAKGVEFSGEVAPAPHLNGKPPQDEVDAAYQQLAQITGEPVDAVTPYRPDMEEEGTAGPDIVVDPVAVRAIEVKQTRTVRALSSLRSARTVRSSTIQKIESERRDFRAGMDRTKRVARKMGQSVTAAAREYRARGTWRRGRAPSREHVVRRLPKKRVLATQG
ncbi:MAG TPA: hypothetical protein VFK11_05165 [Candidatus Saccharimonadales bacterium]|nr:hypothetical protein [Candidatus Saccharimonadales bacterium]